MDGLTDKAWEATELVIFKKSGLMYIFPVAVSLLMALLFVEASIFGFMCTLVDWFGPLISLHRSIGAAWMEWEVDELLSSILFGWNELICIIKLMSFNVDLLILSQLNE